MHALINRLWAYYQNYPPFIDETGIEDNIDFIIKNVAIGNNFEELRRIIENMGLQVMPGKMDMKVVVIR